MIREHSTIIFDRLKPYTFTIMKHLLRFLLGIPLIALICGLIFLYTFDFWIFLAVAVLAAYPLGAFIGSTFPPPNE